MIGEIAPSGSSFAEALAYALNLKSADQKLSEEELAKKFPEVVPTPDDLGWKAGTRHRIIAGNVSGETELELRREFAAVRKLRSDIKNPLISLSARKAPGDTINLQAWEEIAERVITGLELKGCPFLVVQHRDKDAHIHIITSRIRLDGKVISDSKSYEKVERVMREVEIKYSLERVRNSSEVYDRAPTWWEHNLVNEKGALSPKLEMQARISAVLEDRPTTTQFINRLREAHGIKPIFKVSADGVPSGVAFKYRDVVMSGGALGRGYTWKKLQERGLRYDERDIEAVERTGEGARPRRQSITDQERAVGRVPRTVGDAGRGAVHDQPVGGAIREAVREHGGREAQGQQCAARPSVSRGDHQPSQAGLSEAEANNGGVGGGGNALRYESIADRPFPDNITTPRPGSAIINFDPNIADHTEHGFLRGPGGVEQSTAVPGGSEAAALAGATRLNMPMDIVNSDLIRTASDTAFDDPSTPYPAAAIDGFRDGLREAIRGVDDYMKDFWQEDAQYQSAIPIDLGEISETSVKVEIEAEAIIDIMML
jgi:Relaxase/Mobilisation nuclease domain